jgi:hypothetical protein
MFWQSELLDTRPAELTARLRHVLSDKFFSFQRIKLWEWIYSVMPKNFWLPGAAFY